MIFLSKRKFYAPKMGPLLLATTKSGCNVCPVSILPLLIMIILLFTICQLALIHYAIESYKARNEAFNIAFKFGNPKPANLQNYPSPIKSINFSTSELNYFKLFEPVLWYDPNPSTLLSAHSFPWFGNDSYLNTTIIHGQRIYKSFNMAEPLCPNTSAQLNHRVESLSITATHAYFPKTSVSTREPLEQVKAGGRFAPKHCRPIFFVAIIIPYRDRISTHLNSFLLNNLHPVLQRHQFSYAVYIVEQFGNRTFNKGALMNAGFLLAFNSSYKETGFDCIIFQDMDFIFLDDNLYSCSTQQPTHVPESKHATLGNRISSNELVGRIFSILTTQFFTVNGFSNYYWDWNGGYDDMVNRLIANGINVKRPNQSFAGYKIFLPGSGTKKNRTHQFTPTKKLLQSSKLRFAIDGLSSIKFHLVSTEVKNLYTKFVVDLGEPNTLWNSK